MSHYQFLWRGILAGVAISIGGLIYLRVGGVAGAALFSVGLLAVVFHSLLLFTGKSGDCGSRGDLGRLALILLLNIVGCALFSLLIDPGEAVLQAAEAIVMKRAESGIVSGLGNGIGCGFIMTLAVHAARKQHYWPLLIGIPAFIMAGFTHCIADAFYYSVAWSVIPPASLATYALTVIGNFIGCNLYRCAD